MGERSVVAVTDLTAMTATTPTPVAMDPQQKVLSGSREAMEPLYERLLAKSFNDSASAVEFCRSLCSEFGFTVKQEASANKHIYVYCSREGLPDSQRRPRTSPQRRRPSSDAIADGEWFYQKQTVDNGNLDVS